MGVVSIAYTGIAQSGYFMIGLIISRATTFDEVLLKLGDDFLNRSIHEIWGRGNVLSFFLFGGNLRIKTPLHELPLPQISVAKSKIQNGIMTQTGHQANRSNRGKTLNE
jgi:hypothetical protein